MADLVGDIIDDLSGTDSDDSDPHETMPNNITSETEIPESPATPRSTTSTASGTSTSTSAPSTTTTDTSESSSTVNNLLCRLHYPILPYHRMGEFWGECFHRPRPHLRGPYYTALSYCMIVLHMLCMYSCTIVHGYTWVNKLHVKFDTVALPTFGSDIRTQIVMWAMYNIPRMYKVVSGW